jgi:hypothetical protein
MSQPTSRWQLFKHWQGLKVWEQWLIATAIAQLVSLGILTAANALIQLTVNPNISVVLILVGILQGASLGFAQWCVLRQYIRHIGWWIVATIVGALLAWGLGTMVDVLIALFIALSIKVGTVKTIATLVGIFLLGTGVGTILGYAQWLVLESHIRNSFIWIIANAIAWAVGLLLAFMSVGFVRLDEFTAHNAIVWVTTGTSMGAVIGGITGIALIWLLTPRLRHRH